MTNEQRLKPVSAILCCRRTIALGVFVFGERPKPVHVLAILLAVIAVLVQLFAYGSLPQVSLTLALGFALYGAIRKQINADSMGLFLESLCMAPFAALWILTHDGSGMGEHALRLIYFYSARVPSRRHLSHVRGRNACATSFYDWITHLCRPVNTAHRRCFRADGAGNECYCPDIRVGVAWRVSCVGEAGYSARKLQKLRAEPTQKL